MSSPGDGSGDDAELDDAHLHDLRAVLREMPDEEPPMRGMAELMAAARARVAPPAPSLWQRIAAFTRRPMVLALASVTLVAGGAVLVQRHHVAADQADVGVAPAELRESSASDPGATGAAAPTTIVLGNGETRATAGSAATTAIAIDGKPGGGEIAMATTPSRPEPVVTVPPRRPAAHTALNDRRPNAVLAIPDAKPAAPATPPTVPMGEDEPAPAVGGGGTPMADQAPEAVARPAHVSAGAATPTAPPAAVKADAGSPVAQWLQQCERAAAASDCDAVRRLAARISEADPTFYRAHVAKDAVLAHCLTTVLSE